MSGAAGTTCARRNAISASRLVNGTASSICGEVVLPHHPQPTQARRGGACGSSPRRRTQSSDVRATAREPARSGSTSLGSGASVAAVAAAGSAEITASWALRRIAVPDVGRAAVGSAREHAVAHTQGFTKVARPVAHTLIFLYDRYTTMFGSRGRWHARCARESSPTKCHCA